MTEDFVYQILELCTVIFETFIVHQYVDYFFDRRIKTRHVFMGYSLFCFGLATLSLIYRNPIVLTSYTLTGIFALTFFCYKGDVLPKIFSALFFCILMVGSEIVCVWIISTWGDISLENIHEYGFTRALYIVTAKITELFTVKYFGICVKWKVSTLDKIELKGAFLLILCQMFSLILSNNVFMTAFHTHINLTFSELLSIFAVMYINIFAFWYFDRIKAAYEYKHEKEIAETIFEFQRQYYELLEENQQETESLWHDMKKHVSTIKGLYERDYKSDTEQYIDILDNKINAIPKIVRTSAPVINVIIVDALRKAKKENIDVRLDIKIDRELKINAYDLCILLGNTIENAIEACRLLPDEVDRYICVSLLQNDSLVLIDIKNPFISSNDAIPKKSGKHGYGLKNVRKVVRRYGGDIEINNLYNIYHVSLIIP